MIVNQRGQAWVGKFEGEVGGGVRELAEKPDAPGNLIANVESASWIAQDWEDNSGDEAGFKIERSVNDGEYEPLAITNVASYKDDSVAGENSYQYRVNAYNGGDDSHWIKSLVVNTPAGLTLGTRLKREKQVTLHWNGSVSSDYLVFRNNVEIDRTVSPASSFSDRIKAKGHGSFVYRVCEIVNGLGSGNCSNDRTVKF